MGKARDVEESGKGVAGMEHVWDFVEVVSLFNTGREVHGDERVDTARGRLRHFLRGKMFDCVSCFIQDVVVLFEKFNKGRFGRCRSSGKWPRWWDCVRIGKGKRDFAEKRKVEYVFVCHSIVDVEGRPVDVENEYVWLCGFRCMV